MPLFGHHSRAPFGNPQDLSQMQQLAQVAQRGPNDPAGRTALAALSAIAAGSTTTSRGGSGGVPIGGYFGDQTVNWGSDEPGRAQERQFAQALLSGNTDAASQIYSAATGSYQPWTGGTLANLAPIAAAFIPGVGPAAAAVIGAGLGALESATGVTNISPLGGATRGAALGGGGALAKGALFPGTSGTTLTRDAQGYLTSSQGGGGGLGGLLSGAGRIGSGIGRFALGGLGGKGGGRFGLGNILGLGLAGLGTLQGARQFGRAGQLENQVLSQAQAQQRDRDILRRRALGHLGTIPQRPDLGSLFAGSQNPFARFQTGGRLGPSGGQLGPLTAQPFMGQPAVNRALPPTDPTLTGGAAYQPYAGLRPNLQTRRRLALYQ